MDDRVMQYQELGRAGPFVVATDGVVPVVIMPSGGVVAVEVLGGAAWAGLLAHDRHNLLPYLAQLPDGRPAVAVYNWRRADHGFCIVPDDPAASWWGSMPRPASPELLGNTPTVPVLEPPYAPTPADVVAWERIRDRSERRNAIERGEGTAED